MSPSFVEWACVVVYTSWFVVPPLAALYVSVKAPARIGSFFMWWIAIFYVSLPIFVLFPLAPPWMADPHVQRLASLAVGQIDDNNQFAAMPSLHVALPAVLGFWFVRERWRWPAAVMLGYAALIGFEVVVSGEHYIVDVIAGFSLAGAIYLVSQVDWRDLLARAGRSLGNRTSESGQALIEFVFIFPLLFVLVVILFQGGLAISHRIELQHAIREGGRYASFGHTPAEIQTKTLGEVGDIDSSDVTVDVCYENGGAAGTTVRVRAHYTYQIGAGGELLTALVPGAASIDMDPKTEFTLEAPANDLSGAVAWNSPTC